MTSGIDMGDIAEKRELLGLGQSLIYSIEQTELPIMLVVLCKGSAAAHYVMGGPTANNNAFTLGTLATQINVMHGETAAAASYVWRLVKEKDAGKSIKPVIGKMNEMVKHYEETSRPSACAKKGFVENVIRFAEIRWYMVAFAGGIYQNPCSICLHHHMLLPRMNRSQVVTGSTGPKRPDRCRAGSYTGIFPRSGDVTQEGDRWLLFLHLVNAERVTS